MARVVIKDAKGPYILQEGVKKGICMCGLSGSQPFCDGSHRKAGDEEAGKLYSYEGGEQKEVRIENA